MQRFTLPDRLEIVQRFYPNSRSFVSTRRSFSQSNDRHRIEREFTLHYDKPPTRQRIARSNENIAAVKSECNRSAKFIDSKPFTRIQKKDPSFANNNLANFAIGLGPTPFQDGVDTATQAARAFEASWICWLDVGAIGIRCQFWSKNHLFPMRHIFGWMVTSTSKIIVIWARKTHKCLKNCLCIHKDSLCGMVYGMVAILVFISWKWGR